MSNEFPDRDGEYRWYIDWRFYTAVAATIAVVVLAYGLVTTEQARRTTLDTLQEQATNLDVAQERMQRLADELDDAEQRVEQLIETLKNADIAVPDRP